jgi:hypothetical protein
MTITIVPLYYYITAKEEYENSNDIKYHLSDDTGYKFNIICDHARWLYIMNECIRIWE